MKRKLLIMSFFVLILLSSCNIEKKKVSIFYYNQGDVYINYLGGTIKNDLENTYSITEYNAELSQLKQNSSLVEAINNNTNIVLMNPYDRFAAKAILDKCNKSNIPVIFFNREPLFEDINGKNECYYVGPDSYTQGKLQIDVAKELFGDPKNLNEVYDLNHDNTIQLIILKGEQSHQDAEKRTQSNINTLEAYGYKFDLLSISICDWSEKKANETMQKLISSGLKPELILANNDEMAIGAANYFKNNYEVMVPIIGIDATERGIAAVNNKSITATIVNDSQAQAKVIGNLVRYYLDGAKLDLEEYNKKGNFIYIDSYIYGKTREVKI